MKDPQRTEEPDLPFGTVVKFIGDLEALLSGIPERWYLEPALLANKSFKITDKSREFGSLVYELEPLAVFPEDPDTHHSFYVSREDIEIIT